MGLRFGLAKAVGATLTWGLRNVFRRPAANTPGKIALYVDPRLIADLSPRLRAGSVVVVGTNGKTTVTNLLADVAERAGKHVVCNRTGANLDSGVATALMQGSTADWGVFESDELWLAKILPQLKATYVVLLNLFRDQLDRCGEIDRIQDSIVDALGSSPDTVLVYNADDPLCAMIAERAAQLPGRAGTRSVAFGIGESMGLEQNTVSDAAMCQRCSSMFRYEYRQYGQLGDYCCPRCGFSRPVLSYEVSGVDVGPRGLSFDLAGGGSRTADDPVSSIRAPYSGAYMVYNLAAVAVAADLLGCSGAAVQAAIDAFDPRNGRLQELSVDGRHVLLNLAKNPTGFNQNLKIVSQDEGAKAVAFFVNDKEADGRDISWIWDIDFEELTAQEGCVVFAGGMRRNDLQVRLKYAGVDARLVESMDEVLSLLPQVPGLPGDASLYAIANYTALPSARASLEAAAARSASGGPCAEEPAGQDASRGVGVAEPPAAAGVDGSDDGEGSAPAASASAGAPSAAARGSSSGGGFAPAAQPPVVIAHLFPDLLNLYGDGGNVRVLEQRCRWRDIPVEVRRVRHGETIDFSDVDLVFLGGGPDREQKLATEELARMREGLAAFVREGGALLAICGGYQILGRTWLLGDEEVPGLAIAGIETRRPGTSADRLIGDIVLRSDVAGLPVVGYENHAGRTYLDERVCAFGAVSSAVGGGNNDHDKADGVLFGGVVGTYLHGPLLSKNPEVADWLLARALDRRAGRAGLADAERLVLAPLDDAAEIAANEFMCARLGISR